MSTSMLAALAGANYIHDAAGLIESGMTVAYEQYVIDDEINGMVMRAVRGIEVNEESLAVNVVKAVGAGGNFLAEQHTINHMRSEFYVPQVANRTNRINWEAEGSIDGRTKAQAIAKNILEKHKPLPIEEKIIQEIQREIPEVIV